MNGVRIGMIKISTPKVRLEIQLDQAVGSIVCSTAVRGSIASPATLPATFALPTAIASDQRIRSSIADFVAVLGDIPTGVYADKDRSVYWNGCNNAGEKVSSGVYFYTLQAGEYSATKRMLILK